jgi:hypothetical protein
LTALDSTTSATYTSSAVHTYLSNADGTVTPVSTAPTGVSAPAGLSAADFNGDHELDFAVAGATPLFPTRSTFTGGAVAVMFGLGKGAISPPAIFRTGMSPQSQAVMDVNGDGRPDILSGGPGGISTLLNLGVPVVAATAGDVSDAGDVSSAE